MLASSAPLPRTIHHKEAHRQHQLQLPLPYQRPLFWARTRVPAQCPAVSVSGDDRLLPATVGALLPRGPTFESRVAAWSRNSLEAFGSPPPSPRCYPLPLAPRLFGRPLARPLADSRSRLGGVPHPTHPLWFQRRGRVSLARRSAGRGAPGGDAVRDRDGKADTEQESHGPTPRDE